MGVITSKGKNGTKQEAVRSQKSSNKEKNLSSQECLEREEGGVSASVVSAQNLTATLFTRAEEYYRLQNFSEAIGICISLTSSLKNQKQSTNLSSTHLLLANCYLKQYCLKKAHFHFNEAYLLTFQYDCDNADNIKAHSLLSIANCNKYLKEPTLALGYISKFKKQLHSNEDLNYQSLILEATLYTSLGDYSASLVLYKRLLAKKNSLKPDQLSLLNISLAGFYRETGDLVLSSKYSDLVSRHISEELEPFFLLELSKLYIKRNDFSEATKHLTKAYPLAKKQRYLEVKMELLLCLSFAYFKLGNPSLALKELEIANSLLLTLDIPLIKSKVDSLFAEIYLAASDYKNYLYHVRKVKAL
ncbi:MAG: tetratricopeptide repeat protein [Alkaliphilus sp.]